MRVRVRARVKDGGLGLRGEDKTEGCGGIRDEVRIKGVGVALRDGGSIEW